MKIEQGCTIIKTKELEGLYKQIRDSETAHGAEVKELKKSLKEMEETKKPDEIKIRFFIYGESHASGWRSDNFVSITPEITEQLNLSRGIHQQIRRILNTLKYEYNKIYKSIYDKEIDKAYKQNIKNVNYNLRSLAEKFKNRLYTRSAIKDIIEQQMIKL